MYDYQPTEADYEDMHDYFTQIQYENRKWDVRCASCGDAERAETASSDEIWTALATTAASAVAAQTASAVITDLRANADVIHIRIGLYYIRL